MSTSKGKGETSGYKLSFISGKYQGGSFPLIKNTEMIIGRSGDLDIVIVEDMVSRKHAKILIEDEQIYIQDLGSTNGSFVNGERIKRIKIKNGDRILIGTSVMRVENENASENEFASEKVEVSQVGSDNIISNGSLEIMPPNEILVVICGAKKSGVLIVEGEQNAKIYFNKGQIYYCTIDDNPDVNPTKSLHRFLAWNSGNYSFKNSNKLSFENEIMTPTEDVIKIGVNENKQMKKVLEDAPSAESVLSVAMPLEAPLRNLTPDELDIVQLVYNHGQIETVVDESSLTDLKIYKIITYLIENEYINAF